MPKGKRPVVAVELQGGDVNVDAVIEAFRKTLISKQRRRERNQRYLEAKRAAKAAFKTPDKTLLEPRRRRRKIGKISRITPATALYKATVAQIRVRIKELGLTMWQCDDKAGLQDGYTAKLLNPDTPSGRQAGWDTLQLLVDALWPDGFEIEMAAQPSNKSKR